LDQVLTNLLTNAIKYTPRGGGIEVRVQAEGPEAKVTVSDTGVGIAPELLAKVFEMFAQAEQSRDRTKGGMGLGLTVVRSLVQLHGGTVEAFSAGPGAGSAFVVTLPLLEPTEAQQPVPAPSVKPTCSQRVVVVEDSDDNREMLTELLKLAGHEVCEAETGPQGLECILSCAPDTAFVDIGLPGFDGLELARRARAQGSNARLIALTGYGQSQDRKEALAAGFDEHLRKPVMNIDLQRAMVAVRR
jgi:CheY-like chemotaxis protein